MNYKDLSREELVEALRKMEEEVEKNEKNAVEWEKKAKKIKADFENYKKDEDERKKEWKRDAQKQLAEELIEVMDNMERALLTADEESSVYQGVKMVADQLYEKLESKGLQRIDAEGEEFDPKMHKAVDTETHDEHNRIIEQRRKGYMYDDEVLREAEVVVGKSDNNQ
ncbi:MAG: molecular chaperone GrpE [Candidatus Nanohaloarchaea archaeon]|jgi:molecular chaperone GrpE